MESQSSAARAAICVGIDVSQAALDVAVRPASEPGWRSTNDARRGSPRWSALVGRLRPLRPEVIVRAATGGLERLAVAALALAELSVAVVNPRQVRDFAKATGQLATTDARDAARDAARLAHFAQAIRPAPRPLPDAQRPALAAWVERRRQVVGMLTAQKNRVQQALPTVRPHIQTPIAWLAQALKSLADELDHRLHASPLLWRARAHWLRRVPGVGPTLARHPHGRSARTGPRLGQAHRHLGWTRPAHP